MIEILRGGTNHIQSLLELAQSVEHLFGPMVNHGFEQILEKNIERGAILCAIPDFNYQEAVGAIIFDTRRAPDYQVAWLAVLATYRLQGIGRRLLTSALSQAAPPARITVVTFGPDNEAGLPARKLYESLGFSAGAMAERGPEGGTRQFYELRVEA